MTALHKGSEYLLLGFFSEIVSRGCVSFAVILHRFQLSQRAIECRGGDGSTWDGRVIVTHHALKQKGGSARTGISLEQR